MHWDRRFAIVVGVSLIWAVLVSGVFYRVAARSSSGGRGSKPLVVAVERLPLGAVLRPDQVRLSRVPGDLFPKGGFWRIEDVVGRPVVATIEADEPVLAARVAERGSGMGLAPMIPSGMRAASVRVNDVADVAGFILSGMHVDVLATGRAEGHSDTVTRTVSTGVPGTQGGGSPGSTSQAARPDQPGREIYAPASIRRLASAPAEVRGRRLD
jgi:pilus assembly protein CpaB